MVAFGLVVHASVLQCGRRTAMSDARADMLKSFGYPTADTVARAQAYHAILTDLIAELREVHPPEPGFIAGMVCGGGDCESGNGTCIFGEVTGGE